MSIAVSVAVRPSRMLRRATALMSALLLASGFLLVGSVVGDLPAWQRAVAAALSFFPAFFGFYHIARNQKVLHIDISSIGQIRLREDLKTCGAVQEECPTAKGKLVRLSRQSTIWPGLLLLCLQDDVGESVVTILPDSVSRDGFRALSVACRWIAAHNDPNDPEKL